MHIWSTGAASPCAFHLICRNTSRALLCHGKVSDETLIIWAVCFFHLWACGRWRLVGWTPRSSVNNSRNNRRIATKAFVTIVLNNFTPSWKFCDHDPNYQWPVTSFSSWWYHLRWMVIGQAPFASVNFVQGHFSGIWLRVAFLHIRQKNGLRAFSIPLPKHGSNKWSWCINWINLIQKLQKKRLICCVG